MIIQGSEGTCPDCGETFDNNALTGSHLIPTAHRPTVVEISSVTNAMHLHDVTILPRGEERLWPTIKRTLRF